LFNDQDVLIQVFFIGKIKQELKKKFLNDHKLTKMYEIIKALP